MSTGGTDDATSMERELSVAPDSFGAKPEADGAERGGVFAGVEPMEIARRWLAEAEKSEPNDPNAMALATVDPDGLPNVRMVLLKDIEAPDAAAERGRGAFVFYTNFESAKGAELSETPKAALVLHWKSLRRQLRLRGPVSRVEAELADAYYASRAYRSRIGAWASKQSQPLSSRGALIADVARVAARHPFDPPRPDHWGGFRITPVEIEFWADGDFRLHDRFRWRWTEDGWRVQRLNP